MIRKLECEKTLSDEYDGRPENESVDQAFHHLVFLNLLCILLKSIGIILISTLAFISKMNVVYLIGDTGQVLIRL